MLVGDSDKVAKCGRRMSGKDCSLVMRGDAGRKGRGRSPYEVVAGLGDGGLISVGIFSMSGLGRGRCGRDFQDVKTRAFCPFIFTI